MGLDLTRRKSRKLKKRAEEPEYWEKKGYRLPSEAEWEYACRAGATTSRYYGQTDDLIPIFARYLANAQEHAWPVGQLKPNALGLFDMYGNVIEWCYEEFTPYWKTQGVLGALPSLVTDGESHVLRGGSFIDPAMNLRSAKRSSFLPSNPNFNIGFRLARTYP